MFSVHLHVPGFVWMKPSQAQDFLKHDEHNACHGLTGRYLWHGGRIHVPNLTISLHQLHLHMLILHGRVAGLALLQLVTAFFGHLLAGQVKPMWRSNGVTSSRKFSR